jgi:hypothetical protein
MVHLYVFSSECLLNLVCTRCPSVCTRCTNPSETQTVVHPSHHKRRNSLPPQRPQLLTANIVARLRSFRANTILPTQNTHEYGYQQCINYKNWSRLFVAVELQVLHLPGMNPVELRAAAPTRLDSMGGKACSSRNCYFFFSSKVGYIPQDIAIFSGNHMEKSDNSLECQPTMKQNHPTASPCPSVPPRSSFPGQSLQQLPS